ncbi:response regulator, partial [bacterium]|nr:response regulator [bacterium]
MQPSDSSHRILVVDDNPSIHGDFRKILCPRTSQTGTALASLAADIFDEAPEVRHLSGFEMESAYQGQEALSRIKQAHTDGRPYSMAFVDVRMPPGWDGVETISQIWKNHPDLQVVICTAYSDYSWEQIMHKLGETDSLVILRKPFDNVEVLQLAHTLTTKWEVTRRAHSRMADLDQRVEQRTRELQASNLALQQEIQRRSLIEATLRESEERFHQAFESVPVALGIWSPRMGYLDVTPGFMALTGFAKPRVRGKGPADLGIIADTAKHAELLRTVAEGRPVRGVE